MRLWALPFTLEGCSYIHFVMTAPKNAFPVSTLTPAL